MISSIHNARMIPTGKWNHHIEVKMKPSVIHSYNKHMGGMDRNDELIGVYWSLRKTMKWYKKVAVHFIEEAVLNAHIVYQKSNPNHKLRLVDFRLACIRPMLAKCEVAEEVVDATDRLHGRHFLEKIPPTARKQNPTKRCIVCYKGNTRKETTDQCSTCADKLSLCPAPCFRTYHTKANL